MTREGIEGSVYCADTNAYESYAVLTSEPIIGPLVLRVVLVGEMPHSVETIYGKLPIPKNLADFVPKEGERYEFIFSIVNDSVVGHRISGMGVRVLGETIVPASIADVREQWFGGACLEYAIDRANRVVKIISLDGIGSLDSWDWGGIRARLGALTQQGFASVFDNIKNPRGVDLANIQTQSQ